MLLLYDWAPSSHLKRILQKVWKGVYDCSYSRRVVLGRRKFATVNRSTWRMINGWFPGWFRLGKHQLEVCQEIAVCVYDRGWYLCGLGSWLCHAIAKAIISSQSQYFSSQISSSDVNNVLLDVIDVIEACGRSSCLPQFGKLDEWFGPD